MAMLCFLLFSFSVLLTQSSHTSHRSHPDFALTIWLICLATDLYTANMPVSIFLESVSTRTVINQDTKPCWLLQLTLLASGESDLDDSMPHTRTRSRAHCNKD
jgi:hypothetical protein